MARWRALDRPRTLAKAIREREAEIARAGRGTERPAKPLRPRRRVPELPTGGRRSKGRRGNKAGAAAAYVDDTCVLHAEAGLLESGVEFYCRKPRAAAAVASRFSPPE